MGSMNAPAIMSPYAAPKNLTRIASPLHSTHSEKNPEDVPLAVEIRAIP